MSDPRRSSPRVLAAVRRQARVLLDRGAVALVLLGGIDPSFEGTRDILIALGQLGPTFALPGDRVSRSGFRAAVENAGPNVVDLTLVRAVVLPGATLVALPGYHLPLFTDARDQSCGFDEADLRALSELVRTLPGPRVLLAHDPPRGQTAASVDRTFGGINAGDPRLTRWMELASLRFGLFGHFSESSGHATDTRGRPLPPSTPGPSLLLNVGSVDPLPHRTLDGTSTGSTAALIRIAADKASYTLIRASGGIDL